MAELSKAEHGALLKQRMGRGDREAIATALNVSVRTVTNWTSGNTMPSSVEREGLRRLFPGYDEGSDDVERAIYNSPLTEDRQYDVIGYYKRRLREQNEQTEAS